MRFFLIDKVTDPVPDREALRRAVRPRRLLRLVVPLGDEGGLSEAGGRRALRRHHAGVGGGARSGEGAHRRAAEPDYRRDAAAHCGNETRMRVAACGFAGRAKPQAAPWRSPMSPTTTPS